MKKNKLGFIVGAMFVLLVLSWNLVFASEITGDLTTGISSNLGDTVNGVVISTPTANPGPGTYAGPQSIALVAGGSVTIRYTIDGSTPTCSTGTVYSGLIPIATTQTIKAIACYQNNLFSPLGSFGYVITGGSGGGGGGGGSGGGGNNNGGSTGGGGGGGYYGGGGLMFRHGNIKGYGVVDEYDFAMLMADWNKDGTSPADLNQDGIVNEYDMAVLMANWGN